MTYREQLDVALATSGIPSHMHYSLRQYILDGVPVGHFLTAVLSNDLKEAVNRGDEKNLRCLVEYIQFLHNGAPSGCWGSPDAVKVWCKRGGLDGVMAEEAASSDPRRI